MRRDRVLATLIAVTLGLFSFGLSLTLGMRRQPAAAHFADADDAAVP